MLEGETFELITAVISSTDMVPFAKNLRYLSKFLFEPECRQLFSHSHLLHIFNCAPSHLFSYRIHASSRQASPHGRPDWLAPALAGAGTGCAQGSCASTHSICPRGFGHG